MTPEQEKQVEEIFKDFITARYHHVRKLNLNSLRINPPFLYHLAEQLQWTCVRDIVRFLVDETFQRGAVTSAGFQMEKVARVFGRPTAVKGIDFEIHKPSPSGGIDVFYIQVKAGPNTIHKDTKDKIEENFNYALRRNPRAIPLVGITYGTEDEANSFTKALMNRFQVLFGKDFWAFISDDPDCLYKIYEIAMRVATTFSPTYKGHPINKTLKKLLEEKIEEITREWETTYGPFGPAMWKRLARGGEL